MDGRKLAYLEAMDIPVWVSRDRAPAPEADRGTVAVQVGPGNGSTLMVCMERDAASCKLASDVSRALPEVPVWAWPAQGDSGPSVTEAVQESLFTGLVIFGDALAGRLFGGDVPERLGPARVMVVDDFEVLQHKPAARRRFWSRLCAGGMVRRR